MRSSPPVTPPHASTDNRLIERGPGLRSGLRDLPAYLNLSTVGTAPWSLPCSAAPPYTAVPWSASTTATPWPTR